MIERELKTAQGNSRIIVGESLLARLGEFVPRERGFLFVDCALATQVVAILPGWRVISTLSGESAKSLSVVEAQYKKLLAHSADRGAMLIGIGGGAVLDLVGFVAATFLRGVSCAFVPSTLLAQVDASVGGKNGINLEGYKNIVGTIRQPDLVLCDITLLKSLPQDEFLSGLAEVVKHGAIADREILDLLLANREQILNRNLEALTNLVNRSIAVKQQIVEIDPQEKGLRVVLNFGHTVGHALEHIMPIKHGYAVSIGMCVAAAISVNRGLLQKREADTLVALLSSLGLPTKLDAPVGRILEGIAHDKKREDLLIHTVLLEGLGKAVTNQLSLTDWENALTGVDKHVIQGV